MQRAGPHARAASAATTPGFAANPHSHTPNKMAGIQVKKLGALGTDANNGAGDGVKGWLISSIAAICDRIAAAGAFRQLIELPTAAKSARGARNFTDAASHSPCRTAARFLLSTSVTSQITPANSVDCHK